MCHLTAGDLPYFKLDPDFWLHGTFGTKEPTGARLPALQLTQGLGSWLPERLSLWAAGLASVLFTGAPPRAEWSPRREAGARFWVSGEAGTAPLRCSASVEGERREERRLMPDSEGDTLGPLAAQLLGWGLTRREPWGALLSALGPGGPQKVVSGKGILSYRH